jgi:hypothetical protein
MIYEIFLSNGWHPWLALQTTNKEQAIEFLQKTKAQYIYLRVLTSEGNVLRFETQSDQWDLSRSQINGL